MSTCKLAGLKTGLGMAGAAAAVVAAVAAVAALGDTLCTGGSVIATTGTAPPLLLLLSGRVNAAEGEGLSRWPAGAARGLVVAALAPASLARM